MEVKKNNKVSFLGRQYHPWVPTVNLKNQLKSFSAVGQSH